MRTTSKRVCLIATKPALVYMFSRNFISWLHEQGCEVTVITSPSQHGFGDRDYDQELRSRGATMRYIPISREIHLFRDFFSLIRIWWFLLWHRFDIVHCSHPKTMLLGTIAAFFAFQSNRIVTVRGRVYENATGKKRLFYVLLDRMTCFLARKTIVVSHSLREAMLKDKIGTEKSLIVIGRGSSQGCDVDVFSPEKVDRQKVADLRRNFDLKDDNKTILFAGRLRKDKGGVELVEAFANLAPKYPDWRLILVGHEEKASDIGEKTRETITNHSQIIHRDWSSDMITLYALCDIFVLPTWREGFPNVVLEASAMERPVITTNAVGAVDSVIDDETGCLVPVDDPEALAKKMSVLMNDPTQRTQMGQAGRRFVSEYFRPEIIWENVWKLYES